MVDKRFYIVSYLEGDQMVSYLAYKKTVRENNMVSELYYDIRDESVVYIKPEGVEPSEGIDVIELKAKKYRDALNIYTAYNDKMNKQSQKKMNFR